LASNIGTLYMVPIFVVRRESSKAAMRFYGTEEADARRADESDRNRRPARIPQKL
tara:strand:+ start:805 stop:969 length:165 start_codon:yes stop_codon:yes gene_type:complete